MNESKVHYGENSSAIKRQIFHYALADLSLLAVIGCYLLSDHFYAKFGTFRRIEALGPRLGAGVLGALAFVLYAKGVAIEKLNSAMDIVKMVCDKDEYEAVDGIVYGTVENG